MDTREDEKMFKFFIKDALGKMADRGYYTDYHAEQMARALNMNEATHYRMYYGQPRFVVVAA